MYEHAPIDSQPLSALFDQHASDGPDSVDRLLRTLGFEDLAIERLHSGVARDLDHWRHGSSRVWCELEGGGTVAWADASVADYCSHLAGLLRRIGVDRTGRRFRRRRGHEGRARSRPRNS